MVPLSSLFSLKFLSFCINWQKLENIQFCLGQFLSGQGNIDSSLSQLIFEYNDYNTIDIKLPLGIIDSGNRPPNFCMI